MEKKVFVDISARHVHLTQENVNVLFGSGYQMTPRKILGGGFVSEERVELVGPKGTIKNVAILGPYRPTQVEISLTDAKTLGVMPPIRLSGDIKNSASITILGPNGTLELEKGVIVAKRHMHIAKEIADQYGIVNGQVVKVRVESADRTLIFEDIPCRVQSEAPVGPPAVVHIDTDECNAAGMDGPCEGTIME